MDGWLENRIVSVYRFVQAAADNDKVKAGLPRMSWRMREAEGEMRFRVSFDLTGESEISLWEGSTAATGDFK